MRRRRGLLVVHSVTVTVTRQRRPTGCALVRCTRTCVACAQDFFETCAMLITVVILGKYLECSAKGRTSEAIQVCGAASCGGCAPGCMLACKACSLLSAGMRMGSMRPATSLSHSAAAVLLTAAVAPACLRARKRAGAACAGARGCHACRAG
jgi:hypothetical protein